MSEGGEGRGQAGAASPVPPAPGPGGVDMGPVPVIRTGEGVRGKKIFFFFFFLNFFFFYLPPAPSEDGHCNEQYATQMVGWWQGLGGGVLESVLTYSRTEFSPGGEVTPSVRPGSFLPFRSPSL